jgi:hypothetical protein
MTKSLQVRFSIPISEEFSEGILFESWLPSSADVLTAKRESLLVVIWIDPQKFQLGAFPVNLEKEFGDVRIGTIGVDVTVQNVDEELAEFVRVHANDDHKAREEAAGPLRDEYEALGRSVMIAATDVLQRVISFFRVVKGQFWIPQIRFDSENMAGFCAMSSAMVRSETYEWVRWKPSLVGRLILEVRDWGWRKVRRCDWGNLNEFVQQSQKLPLALELLADSERLLRDGLTRAALIESVAALEVTVRQYLVSRAASVCRALLADLEVQTLDALFEKLGLRGSLTVLLPLLISDQELPRDILRESIKAVELRGSVVHRGQRVSQERVRPLLHGLRTLSMRLIELAMLGQSSPNVVSS